MPAAARNKTRKTAFVPRSLFLGVLATTTVIPLCACGGAIARGQDDGGKTHSSGLDGAIGVAIDAFAGQDGPLFTVAAQAFDAGLDAGIDTGLIATVAACCFDATFGVAADAFGGEDVFLGVGAPAFDASR